MLYDPAPLNDPADPGWDMGPYMNYSEGVQNYVYRRLGLGLGLGVRVSLTLPLTLTLTLTRTLYRRRRLRATSAHRQQGRGRGDTQRDGRGRGDIQRDGQRRAESLERGMPAPASAAAPPTFTVEQVLDHRRRASLQASAAAGDWRQP